MTAIGRAFRKAGTTGLFLFLCAAIASLPSVSMAQLPPLRLQVEKAEATFDQRTKEPVVLITLTPRSARLFYEFTKQNIGRATVIKIDDQVVAQPVIREAIQGGTVQISGNFTVDSARELAERLTKGAARVSVELIEK